MKPRTPPPSSRDLEHIASNWILRRDAGLTTEEEAEFARWRAADPRHEDTVVRKEKAWATLSRPLDAGQADLLFERLSQRATRRRRRLLSAAAAMVILVGAAGVVSVQRMAAPVVVAQSTVLLPETQTLPDGSIVELRPGAELAVEFSPTRRLVRLTRGMGHFQVAENKARPFIVQAGGVEFRAVGTAFSVEVGLSQVELLVTAGRVAVDKSTGSEPAAVADAATPAAPIETLAQVDAGNRIVVAREPSAAAPNPSALSAAEMSERLAWRVPRLEFSELPLAEAVQLMNRYNRIQFTIHDPGVSKLRISGLFRADNIETFVRLLEGTCGIEADRTGDIIVLKKGAR